MTRWSSCRPTCRPRGRAPRPLRARTRPSTGAVGPSWDPWLFAFLSLQTCGRWCARRCRSRRCHLDDALNGEVGRRPTDEQLVAAGVDLPAGGAALGLPRAGEHVEGARLDVRPLGLPRAPRGEGARGGEPPRNPRLPWPPPPL